MKRLSCLLLGILLVFSLCACQQAAPSSGEAPDQQAITEEATAVSYTHLTLPTIYPV